MSVGNQGSSADNRVTVSSNRVCLAKEEVNRQGFTSFNDLEVVSCLDNEAWLQCVVNSVISESGTEGGTEQVSWPVCLVYIRHNFHLCLCMVWFPVGRVQLVAGLLRI